MTCANTNGGNGGGNGGNGGGNHNSPPNSYDKWRFSVMGGLIVLLIFNNYIFKLTNRIFGNVLTRQNCPTLFGYVLHTIVYILLVRLSMGV
jgi:hypothetical protein